MELCFAYQIYDNVHEGAGGDAGRSQGHDRESSSDKAGVGARKSPLYDKLVGRTLAAWRSGSARGS